MGAGWKVYNYVSSLKIFQTLCVRRLYKPIGTTELLKNKVLYR